MTGPAVAFFALVALAGGVLLAGIVYYWTEGGAAPVRTRHGLTPLRSAVAVVVGLAVSGLVVAAVAVDLSTVLVGRRPVLRVGIWVVLVVGGCEALTGAYGFARRWRSFRPDAIVPTGAVTDGAVTVTGTVTDAETGSAPVTGRTAACWSWTVSVTGPGLRNPSEDDHHGTVDGGTGGVPFAVDDGTGPLRVDPVGATLDLVDERSVTVESERDRPTGFANPAPDTERDYADRPREYAESVLQPGSTVTVRGRLTDEDGTPTLGGSETVVVAGRPERITARYRRRAIGYAIAGVVGVAVGVVGLVWSVGGL